MTILLLSARASHWCEWAAKVDVDCYEINIRILQKAQYISTVSVSFAAELMIWVINVDVV
jgi:hypothetical protein